MAGHRDQQPRRAGEFDALRLAREQRSLAGVVDVAQLSRLDDRVADGPGSVAWRIDGATDGSGRPALAISLEGHVPLECQRCLAVFEAPVAQRTLTLLARSEAEADSLDADSEDEVLVADHPIDPLVLVEDELLLCLPYAPMHADGACESRSDDA